MLGVFSPASQVNGKAKNQAKPRPKNKKKAPKMADKRATKDDLVVKVGDLGKVRGIDLGDDHRAWLGIPYAEPPLGKLRFVQMNDSL